VTNEPPETNADGRQPHVERGGLWALFFSAAGLLLPPYGVVLSALAIFQGRKARRAARANRGQAPGALLSMVLGWVGVVLSVSSIAFYAMVWTEYTDYRDCSTRALTVATQDACDEAFGEALTARGLPPEVGPALTGSGA
jgi:hypothetical protein